VICELQKFGDTLKGLRSYEGFTLECICANNLAIKALEHSKVLASLDKGMFLVV